MINAELTPCVSRAIAFHARDEDITLYLRQESVLSEIWSGWASSRLSGCLTYAYSIAPVVGCHNLQDPWPFVF